MNRYTVRIVAALLALLVSSCTENDQIEVPLHALWEFKESSGGLLGKVTADRENPWYLEYTSDGKVKRWGLEGKTEEYFYEHINLPGVLYIQYKYNKEDKFQQFHRAIIDGDELTLIPFLGENTSCNDCPTEVFRKTAFEW